MESSLGGIQVDLKRNLARWVCSNPCKDGNMSGWEKVEGVVGEINPLSPTNAIGYVVHGSRGFCTKGRVPL